MQDRNLTGQILLEKTRLTEEQLDEALGVQQDKGGRIGEILVSLKYVSEEEIQQALSQKLGIPFVDSLAPGEIDPTVVGAVPIHFAKQHCLIPVKRTGDHVTVAVADPHDYEPLDDLRILLEADLDIVLATSSRIVSVINEVYQHQADTAASMMDDLSSADLDHLASELSSEPEDLLDSADEAPIIKLINSLLAQAVKERASDIHIESFEQDISVRFRIDGVLYEIIRAPKRIQAGITSRVKVMAGLNIAEKRLPQDGRIRLKIAGRDIDIRLSTVPTSFGERVVMRLLDRSQVLLHLTDLGFSPDRLAGIEKLIRRPHGIILVTGPTGSGKTTSLYAALSKINTPDKNIITVEDPVEYQLQGIGQIQVNPKIDLTFAKGLRSILRQDPDIIMVGEIRDFVTAEIAIQASLTGHLVFSTLHTNDAPGAITRLIDMGVEPFLVASSVIAILAQRLVRCVCRACAETYTPSEEELQELGVTASDLPAGGRLYRATGCEECLKTGYSGRTGIYELLQIDDQIRSLVLSNADTASIRKKALEQGMQTLRMDGAQKVLRGKSTMSEVLRVTEEDIHEN